ncbi:hypothetical protein J6590_090320, partial [Homalodisca vitripennis]
QPKSEVGQALEAQFLTKQRVSQTEPVTQRTICTYSTYVHPAPLATLAAVSMTIESPNKNILEGFYFLESDRGYWTEDKSVSPTFAALSELLLPAPACSSAVPYRPTLPYRTSGSPAVVCFLSVRSTSLKLPGVDLSSSEGSAGELRKRLSHCLSTNVPADAAVVNNLDVETELEECEAKLSDLSSLVSDYDGNRADNEFQRLSARLWHLYYHVERIPDTASTDIEPGQRKSELLVKTKTFIDSFISTAPQNIPSTYQDSSKITQKTTKSVETSEVGKALASDDINVRKTQYLPLGLLPQTVIDRSSAGYSTDQVPFQESRDISISSRSKSVPVYKWGIQFDNSPGQSIGAFLERVEKLRRARGVTPQELFNSAVDLFSGSALIWYRSTQSRI